MKQFITCTFLALLVEFSFAQEHLQKQLDSLNIILSTKESHDTSVAAAYIQLSELLFPQNLDTVAPLCRNAIKVVERALSDDPDPKTKLRLKRSMGEALNNLGVFYDQKGDIPNTIEYYKRSLAIQEQIDNKPGVATCLMNIGIVFQNQGDIPNALEYYSKSLAIQEIRKDDLGVAKCLGSLGGIYATQKDFEKSLEYFKKSLDIYTKLDKKAHMAFTMGNIGTVYANSGDLVEGRNYLQKGLILQEEMGHKKSMGTGYVNLGALYLLESRALSKAEGNADSIAYKREKALEYYERGVAINEEIGYKKGLGDGLVKTGGLYFEFGRIKEAEEYSKRGLDVGQEIGYPKNIKDAAQLLSKIYEKKASLPGTTLSKQVDLWKDAFSNYKLFIEMRDSINNERTKKVTAKQQVKYEYEKQKAIDDAENEKLLAISAEQEQKQRIISYSIGGGLGLVFLFSLFVVNRLRLTRKQKRTIEKQKEHVEFQRDIAEKQKVKIAEQHVKLESVLKEVTDSINYAQKIQQAILPPLDHVNSLLSDSFIYYQPKDIVSGDFYWVHQIKDKVLFAAVDCTGHGVPGALMSIVGYNLLEKVVGQDHIYQPSDILTQLNNEVIKTLRQDYDTTDFVKDGMDMSLCSLDLNKMELEYSGAHNPLYLIRGDEFIITKSDKKSIGGNVATKEENMFTNHKIPLQKGDILYIFSDGFADQKGGERGKKFFYPNFRKTLLEIHKNSMEKQKELLQQTFNSWKGSTGQMDDVLVFGVKV